MALAFIHSIKYYWWFLSKKIRLIEWHIYSGHLFGFEEETTEKERCRRKELERKILATPFGFIDGKKG